MELTYEQIVDGLEWLKACWKDRASVDGLIKNTKPWMEKISKTLKEKGMDADEYFDMYIYTCIERAEMSMWLQEQR